MRLLNNSGKTQSLTKSIKPNLSNNLGKATVTKVDLTFKQGIERTMHSQEICIPEADREKSFNLISDQKSSGSHLTRKYKMDTNVVLKEKACEQSKNILIFSHISRLLCQQN